MFSEDLTKAMNEKYSESSIKQFIKIARFINRTISKPLDNMFDFKNIDKYEKTIIEALQKYNCNTRQTYSSYIILLYKLDHREPPKIFNEFTKKTKDEQSKINEDNNKQKLINLDNDDIYKFAVEKVGGGKGHPFSSYTQLCLISILKEVPLRLSELVNMRFENDGCNNYVDIETKKMYVKNHKNSKRKEITYTHNLSEQIIKDILMMKNKYNTTLLFPTSPTDSKPASMALLCNHWERLVKSYCKDKKIEHVKYGIHNIRHNHATNKLKELNIDSEIVAKLRDIKDSLKHLSLETMLVHYLKAIQTKD